MTDSGRIDDIVFAAAEAFGVPSVSLSVIRNGEQRNIAAGCGENTVFPLGELSKVYLSDAVRSCGMELDRPVIERSQWFRMKEPGVSELVTVRDILLQRTGLPEHRVSWFIQPDLSMKDVSELAGYLDPACGFRERPMRQDHLFASLSRIVEDCTGASWEQIVKSEVLEPVSSQSTYFSWQHLSGSGCEDVALPFYSSYGSLREGTRWMTDPLAGGGSMFCSMPDLARTAEKKRTSGDTETVPVGDWDVFEYPASLIGADGTEGGDGWYRMDILGNRIVLGTGTSGGSRVFAGWMEDQPLSFAAAANLDGSLCADAVCLALCETVSGRAAKDWNGRMRAISDSVSAGRRRSNSALLRACTDDMFSAACTGLYFNDGYGELYFFEEYGGLFLEMFGVPMRIYHTSSEICILDATEVLGRAVPCTVSAECMGLMLEPKTGKMTDFPRKS